MPLVLPQQSAWARGWVSAGLVILAGAGSVFGQAPPEKTPPRLQSYDPFSPPRPPAPALPERPKSGQPATERRLPAVIQDRQVRPANNVKTAPARVGPRLLTAEEQNFARAATLQADQLRDQAWDAFRKGLMPLQDFAVLQGCALQTQQLLAEATGRSSEIGASLDRQARLMAEAAGALKGLAQPGATNYEADIALAETLAAEAQWRQAEWRKDRLNMDRLLTRRNEAAARHWQLRREYFAVGQTDHFQLIQAAELTFGVPAAQGERPEQRGTLRRELETAVSQLHELRGRGAGLGREDRAELGAYLLARFERWDAQLEGDLARQEAKRQEALQHADRAFGLQMEFSRKGTASLFDLARTWSLRNDMHLQAEATTPVFRSEAESLEADLAQIHQLARQTTDLRGRNLGDVGFVTALKHQEQLRRWR